MKILWLTTDRSKRVAQLFTPIQREMAKFAEVEVHEGDIWYRRDYFQRRPDATPDPDYASEFDIVFTDAVFAFMDEKFWTNVRAFKAVLIEDCHGDEVADYTRRAFDDYGIDLFFYRYREGFSYYHPYVPDIQKAWLPHNIDPDIFHPYPIEQEPVALMTGAFPMRKGVYKFRNQIHDALETQTWYRRIERPPEGKENVWPRGEAYAKELSKARVAFATASIYRYPVAKYFEIPVCGTLLLAQQIPELQALGFRDGVNYVALNMDGDLVSQTRAAMERPDYDEIVENGRELITQRHTANTRALELYLTLVERANAR